MSFRSIGSMFKQCFPIFVALFLYAVVDNTPKFVMELTLPYENQLYFNALYFPAQALLLTVGLIYKPQLVRMAATWADRTMRKRFDIFIVVMLLGVVLITILMVLFMKYAGVAILGLLYGVDFEKFRTLSYMMIIAGGMTGAIDFLYQVITIMRRQELVTRTYLVAFAVGVASSILLIHFGKLEGAVTSYLVVMSVLFVALLWVYISQRVSLARHPERDMAIMLPAPGETGGVNAALSGYGTRVANEAGVHQPETSTARRREEGLTTGSVRRDAQVGASMRSAGEAQRSVRREAADASASAMTRDSGPRSDAAPAKAASGHAEDRKKVHKAAEVRSAIIAEEISALDKILPSVPDDGLPTKREAPAAGEVPMIEAVPSQQGAQRPSSAMSRDAGGGYVQEDDGLGDADE